MLRPLSLIRCQARPQFPQLITTIQSESRYYTTPPTPTLQEASVTLSFDPATHKVLDKFHHALSPWLLIPCTETKLFDIFLDPDPLILQSQASSIQEIVGKLQRFEIGQVTTGLELHDFVLRIAGAQRRKRWGNYCGNINDKFKVAGLAPRNLPRLPYAQLRSDGPNLEFGCKIDPKDMVQMVEMGVRLTEQFPDEIILGNVEWLNIYKEKDGRRWKSSFEIKSENRIIDNEDPFAWGLSVPIPLGVRGMGRASTEAAMQDSFGEGRG